VPDRDAAPRQLPAASDLVAPSRARLATELQPLAEWGSPLLWARLCARTPPAAVSLGALVHYIRVALQAGDTRAAQQLFVALLERTAGLNRQWAARAVARTPGLGGAAAEQVREELHQELTLRLWEQLARAGGEQWELFFQHALDFAQRHTATAFMEQRGYWASPGIARPARLRSLLLSTRVSIQGRLGEDGASADAAATVADGVDHFTRADLADLRGLALRLPARERLVIVMRYWQQASEDEIAVALGGASTRTVRNYQRRAFARLREWYAGAEAMP
jgi:DNA-directed RNA polymerase specialized sigma24 family protein